MKKYLWTLSVMALFAIGFAASDDDSSNSNSSSSSQTEQKQETEAERQERERQEEAERQERERTEMKKELLDYACEWANFYATRMGQNVSRPMRDGQCKTEFLKFLKKHSTSGTDDNMQLYEEFKKAWDAEYDKVEAAKRAMDNF